MESPHPDERPAKKRRFFADNSSPVKSRRSKTPNPPPQSPPRHPDEETGGDDAELHGFDVGMLQAVVGELPHSTLRKLKDVSSSNVERGRLCRVADVEALG